MSFETPYKIRMTNPSSNIDEHYGPYNSTTEALTALQNLRGVGKTVGVIENGAVVEYWFKSGIDDVDLVKKTSEVTSESINTALGFEPQRKLVYTDTEFGLVHDPNAHDPALAINQSAKFQALIENGGGVRLTSGNKYYIPDCQNLKSTKSIHITTSKNDLVYLYGNGNELFRPENNFRSEYLCTTGFECTLNGTNSVPVKEVRMHHGEHYNQSYFYRGVVNTEIFDFQHNKFYDFSYGLFLETAGTTITNKQIFSHNEVDDVARYCYRMVADAPLYFEDNDITNVTSRDFEGVYAVARVIQRGSRTVNYVRKNRVDNIISGDANSNFIYWSDGDLYCENNTIGFLSDGGYIVQEKSTTPKDCYFVGNKFTSKINPTGFTKTLLYRLPCFNLVGGVKEFGTPTTVMTGNVVEKLKGHLFQSFNNTSELLGFGAPANATIQGNYIKEKIDAAGIVYILQGGENYDIKDNVVIYWRTDGTLASSESIKRFVAIELTASNVEVRNINIENNQVYFDDADGYEACLVWASALNAASQISFIVDNNKMTGANYYLRVRNNVGDISATFENNKPFDGIDAEINGALESELFYYKSKNNLNNTETVVAVPEVGTGSELRLDNYAGINYNYDAAIDAASFTAINPSVNGIATSLINVSQATLDTAGVTEPKVYLADGATEATIINGDDFVVGVPMELVVQSKDGINIQYYFLVI